MNDTEDFTQEEKDDRLIKSSPYGYVINRGGPNGVDTHSPFYGLKRDDMNQYCYLVLVEAFGHGAWVRYYRWDIVIY